MSSNKGISFDGISDTWIKTTKRWDLLADVWRYDLLINLKKFGSARLIPLNKVHPDLPQSDQFRPITILSSLYKWIETRFLITL